MYTTRIKNDSLSPPESKMKYLKDKEWKRILLNSWDILSLRLACQFSKNFEVFWGWGLKFSWGFLRFYPRKTSKFEVRLRAAVLRLRVKFWGFFEVLSLRVCWGKTSKNLKFRGEDEGNIFEVFAHPSSK